MIVKNEQKSEPPLADFGGFVFLGDVGSERSHRSPALYVPEGFQPERYLRPKLQRYADHARYVLHLIHVRAIFDRRTKHGWVTLKAAYLRRFLPWRQYRAILGDLEAAGVIEIKRDREGRPEWRTGRRSQLYRLGATLRNAIARRYQPQNRILCRKLLEWRDDDHDRTASCPTRCYLKEQLKRLRIDYQAASSCLKGLGLSAEAEAHCQNALVHIQDQDWRFTTDSYGRVHHNISSLKRELRRFLTVDGEQLSEVDISNSQPLFLGLTYLNWLKNGESLFSLNDADGYLNLQQFKMDNPELLLSSYSSSPLPSLSDTVPNSIQSIPYRNTIPLRCDFRHILNNEIGDMGEDGRQSLSQDAVRYLHLCEQGRLYEELAEEAGVDVSTSRARGEFKQKCFRDVFYAKKGYRTALQDLFRRLFPSIMAFIDQVKYKDREHLACWMQRVESSFVINRVVKRFMAGQPGAFILTIHDSVMTKQADIDAALRIFREEFQAFGVHPRLDRKG